MHQEDRKRQAKEKDGYNTNLSLCTHLRFRKPTSTWELGSLSIMRNNNLTSDQQKDPEEEEEEEEEGERGV